MILENAVETTDSTDAHGYSIKYKFVMIHPAGEGIPVNTREAFLYPWPSVKSVVKGIGCTAEYMTRAIGR